MVSQQFVPDLSKSKAIGYKSQSRWSSGDVAEWPKAAPC